MAGGLFSCRAPGCDFKNQTFGDYGKHLDVCEKFVCSHAEFGCEVVGKYLFAMRHDCEFSVCKNLPCRVGGDEKTMKAHAPNCEWLHRRCKTCGIVEPQFHLVEHEKMCRREDIKCHCCGKKKSSYQSLILHYDICSEKYIASYEMWKNLMGMDAMKKMDSEIIEELSGEKWVFREPYSPGIARVAGVVNKLRHSMMNLKKN
ncbi:MAG: hypothetical protein Harvfovirus5_20 [Harvfovirus sp.]|uniref:Uncharacterized protein n=1 Tax=Harvfovirus sp. TaxID=2487768 RepID=A0A3G5A0G7_9VIRU|nr:MAG: hypothetical protein Harvfovirus5_20 [Harvfovirus sp.]